MDLFGVLALASFIVNGALGILVYRKNPRGRANMVFVLFILAIMVWNLSAFFLRTYEYQLNIFARTATAGVILLPVLFLHFSMVFTKRKDLDGATLASIYLFPFLALMLLFTSVMVSGIREAPWGYTSIMGPGGVLLVPYFTVYTAVAYFYLIRSFRQRNSSIEKRQVLAIILGTSVFFVLGNIIYIGNLLMGRDIPPPTEGASIFMAGLISYSIMKENTLGIELGIETPIPAKTRSLNTGLVHILGEDAYSVFSDAIKAVCPGCPVESFPCESSICSSCNIQCPCVFCNKARFKGLFITPHDPDWIKENCDLDVTPGIKIGPEGSVEDMVSLFKDFAQWTSPSLVLLEFGPGHPLTEEKLKDTITHINDCLRDDSAVILALEPPQLSLAREVYSGYLRENLVSILSNPMVRGILRILNDKDRLSFTALQEELDIDTPSKLSYHLRKMRDEKVTYQGSDKLYRLTSMGKIAARTMEKMKEGYLDEITIP